ncbi:EDC3 [Candida oxycetoniae]|uniref:Enhancer of mRNA-decapping protein 3 n=1 Tax=Candida oxycetoniae TaxID=497107 RepID=A0AAI9SVC5_9ASCO|nr:EDC3 [Candida oxycetoniae]KAI3403514.2 EDC3 [Candida oxycetoniae]
MTEFLYSKVNLTLNDGSSSVGVITFVDSIQITLRDAVNTKDPLLSLPSITIPNSSVADIKMIQLPPSLKKKQKPKNFSDFVVDDAILFASKPSRSSTPKPKSSGSSKSTGRSDIEPNSDLDVVGDIKNEEEFDFQANLAMFDKKSIFDNFRKNDHTQLNDTLVGQNKIENISKFKEKEKEKEKVKMKYNNNEMVLDSMPKDKWDSIGTSLGKQRTDTPNSDSARVGGVGGGGPGNNAIRQLSQEKIKIRNYGLVNSIDLKPVQTASPVQLLEIEKLAEDVFGVSSTMMTETCAANLSKLILDSCLGGSVRLSNKSNHNLPPLVLLLIGSGRCGSRAFAIGRYLSNHGVRVLAFVTSFDESDFQLNQQWRSFESIGGKVITSDFEELVDIVENQLSTPLELIIDALQGYDDHLEDIFYKPEDQRVLKRLISWCNAPANSRKVMSLDIPSGIDGGSGILPDGNTKVDCRWCISMGLPLTGILLAYKNDVLTYDKDDQEITHYLIDVGIPNKVYQMKPNLRKFDRFWFSAESCIKLNVAV